MMPDQALQRVAMMYKNDPYILPLVISEDAARKKMRASAQAQMAQPQMKVADQAIMAMAPQPQAAPGIAAIPARNMENMADGGIAGYADGGDVVMAPGSTPSYQRTAMSPGMLDFAQKSEPVIRMAGGGAVQRYQDRGLVSTDLPNAAATMYSSQMGASSDPLAEERRQQYADELALKEAEQVLQSYGVRQRAADPEGFQRALAARDAAAKKVSSAYRLPAKDESEKRFKDPNAITPEELAIYKNVPGRTAPAAPMLPIPDIQIQGAAPGAAPGAGARPPAAPGAATPSEGGIYALAGRMFDPVAQELRQARGRATLEAQRRGDEELAAFEAGKPKGKIAEELERTLRKEEEAEPGERKQAAAMAIFNAGLAMMSGTSPRALENIGKGAMVGSAQYSEALKDMKKAAKERQKMLADIEGARRAEERDDNKTALTLMQRANDAQRSSEMFFTEASAKLGIAKGEAATRLYGEQMQQEGAMARARMQDPLTLYRLLGKGDVEAGLKRFNELKGEPSMIRQLAMEAVKNPAQLKVLESTNPQLYAQIMAEINKLGGGAAGAGIDLSQWGEPQKAGGR